MKSRFSDMAVKLLVSFSILNPALLLSEEEEEEEFSQYGNEEIKALAQFYGNEATVSYNGETYTSHHLLDKDNLIREWQVFKRALKQETVLLMYRKKITEVPPMWEVKVHMECTGAYTGYFQKYLNC